MSPGALHPQIQAGQLVEPEKPLVVDMPPFSRHQNVNSSITVAHPGVSNLGHPFQDQLFLWARLRTVAVDRCPLIQNGAGAPFTDPVPRPQMIDEDAALGWLQSFF